MADERSRADLQALWREQEVEGEEMKIEDIRRKAREMERQIRRRNLAEYLTSAFVVIFFGVHALLAEETYSRLGHALVVAGTVFIVHHLRRRGSASELPEELALEPSRSFHRAELARQRDLLRSVWKWYLLPLVPGLAVLLVGGAVSDQDLGPRIAAFALFCTLLFLAIGKVNAYAARELDREIERLDDAY